MGFVRFDQIEYDLFNSDKDDLKLLGVERIEQSGVPQCLVWYPSITKEQFFLTSNDQVPSLVNNSCHLLSFIVS